MLSPDVFAVARDTVPDRLGLSI